MPRPKKELHSVDVEISGRHYRLSTEEDEMYVRQLADFVTARILNMKRETGASPLDCATITALTLADELNKATAKLERRTRNSSQRKV
jgi:cell division protein ZapA (FtsZ GTPase activity inhibitor)